MNSFAEYDHYDGIGLAKLIRDGDISALEVCEEAIRRAEALNPKLNAIITPLYDYARKTVQNLPPEAPFAGVPFLLKDTHHALSGVPMSSGCELLKGFVPQYDAEIVKRFKKAGLVIFGKTNTPEFKLAGITEPKAFGPTRNPWNLDYSSGGSSGGSAAAIAARIVPFASATDEGGSIRIPAAYCGLFGLKPTRGRNPIGPNFKAEWNGMSTSHVITRSVRDCAAILDAVSGPEPGAPYTVTQPEQPFLNEADLEPRKLRIAFHTRSAYGRKVHPECIEAVTDACKVLEDLGHTVEEAEPVFQDEDVVLNHLIVMLPHVSEYIENLVRSYGSTNVKRNIELQNYAFYRLGRTIKATHLIEAIQKWREIGLAMAHFLNKYDMVLTPTLGEPPVPVGSLALSKAKERTMKLMVSWMGQIILSNHSIFLSILRNFAQNGMKGQMPFTLIANITGQPAMSIPLYWTSGGLPCGVQFIGRFGDEATLLRLAAQLEKAKPWFDKTPPL